MMSTSPSMRWSFMLNLVLATSTMPVREALSRLVTENALEALPNRSTRIPPITPMRMDDLLRARILIEGEAIALAAALATPRLIASLEGCAALQTSSSSQVSPTRA